MTSFLFVVVVVETERPRIGALTPFSAAFFLFLVYKGKSGKVC